MRLLRGADILGRKSPVSRTRPLLAALLGLASVTALVLLGPLSTTSTATATTTAATAAPMTGAPSVGECHRLTLEGLYKKSDFSRRVRCAREHTSRVVKVATLPAGVRWSDPAAKLQRVALRKCGPAWDRALGRTYASRALTAYSGGWFMPTAAQRDRGARWFSCHQILWGGNKSLAPLPTDREPALGKLPHPDKMAVCLARNTFAKTVCARKHVFRGTGVFTIDKKKFPGERAIRKAALKRCPSKVSSRTYRWSFRNPDLWALGDHTVVCYTRTRR